MSTPAFPRLRYGASLASAFRAAAPLFLLVALALAASRFLAGGALWSTLDGATHVYRAFELGRLLDDGQLYPRWTPDFVYDYGYPLFNYYAPLLYYLAEALRRSLGTSHLAAMEGVVVLGLALSGISMYLLASELLGKAAGMLAGVAYLYWPYRLVVVYVRGDVPEVLSYGLLPLVLWGCYRWLAKEGRESGPRRALVLGATAYSAVILTHNLTAFYFTPLLALFCGGLVLRNPRARRRRLLGLAIAFGGSLAATAFFWLPALLEVSWLQQQRLFVADYTAGMASLPGLFQPVSWRYYYYPDTRNLETPFPFGFAALVALAPGLLTLFWFRRRRGPQYVALALLAAALLITVLGMWKALAALSGPLWLLQFPYRLLGLAALGAAPLIGAGYLLLPAGGGARSILRGVALALAIGSLALSSTDRLQPVPSPAGGERLALDSFHAGQYAGGLVGTTWVGEFLPRWVAYDAFKIGHRGPLPADEVFAQGVVALKSPPSLQVLEWRGLRRKVRVVADEDWTLVWHALYFPGWQARIDGRAAVVSPVTSLGLTGVAVPAGEHEVELGLGLTADQWLGTAISMVALAGVLLVAVVYGVQGGIAGRGKRCGAIASGMALVALALVAALAPALSREAVPPARTRAAAQASSAAGSSDPPAILPEKAEDVVFGEGMLLAGYGWQSGPVTPGGALVVDLYWLGLRPLREDYVVFVHLADQDGMPRAQLDRRPVYGYTPTTRWAPGELLHDRYRVGVPGDLPSGRYLVKAGVYRFGSGARLEPRLLARGRDGGGPRMLPDRAVLLGKVVVQGAAGQSPAVTRARFGDELALLDYRLQGAVLTPGEEIRGELVWQALRRPARDYTIFVHLLGRDGIVAQVDYQPRSGRYPTTLWDEGEVVGDSFVLTVPEGTLPGHYRLVAGLYEFGSMRRLALGDVQPGVGATQDTIELGKVTLR